MYNIITFLKGIVLGVANVIPGVSAGTMAVVLKLYDKIVNNLSPRGIKNNKLFFVFLLIGMGIGVVAFSNVITFLFDNYENQTIYFFIGIILGSIPMIYKEGTSKKFDFISIALFAFFCFILVYINTLPESNIVVEDFLNNINFSKVAVLLVAGALAAFAMIIPGVSGSFLMLILGVYEVITSAVKEFNILILSIFGTGVLIGIFIGVKSIKFLLRKYHKKTYMSILGLIVGSLFSLYVPIQLNGDGFTSIFLSIVGFAISYRFSLE